MRLAGRHHQFTERRSLMSRTGRVGECANAPRVPVGRIPWLTTASGSRVRYPQGAGTAGRAGCYGFHSTSEAPILLLPQLMPNFQLPRPIQRP